MRRFPPPGRLVDIGGRSLHLYQTGQGKQVVVLEAGIAATSLSWRIVQTRIDKFATVVSYDRAGLGWSSAPPGPLTLNLFVDDLHALLTAASLPPPYILAGHSFGGLIVRGFARQYSTNTAGLVLVDAVRPADWSPLSDARRDTLARGIRLSRRGSRLARIGLVGWCLRSLLAGSRWLPKAVGGAASGRGLEVMKRLAGEVGKMPRELWPMIVDHWSQPESFLGMAAHLESLPECARETREAPPLEGIPVIAITPAGAPPPDPVGTNDLNVTAVATGHWIHLDEPELIVRAVSDLISH